MDEELFEQICERIEQLGEMTETQLLAMVPAGDPEMLTSGWTKGKLVALVFSLEFSKFIETDEEEE